jgi:hypothetical protein
MVTAPFGVIFTKVVQVAQGHDEIHLLLLHTHDLAQRRAKNGLLLHKYTKSTLYIDPELSVEEGEWSMHMVLVSIPVCVGRVISMN